MVVLDGVRAEFVALLVGCAPSHRLLGPWEYRQEGKTRKGTDGVKLMGSLKIICCFYRTNLMGSLQILPFPQSGKNHCVCSGPISVDPIGPQPEDGWPVAPGPGCRPTRPCRCRIAARPSPTCSLSGISRIRVSPFYEPFCVSSIDVWLKKICVLSSNWCPSTVSFKRYPWNPPSLPRRPASARTHFKPPPASGASGSALPCSGRSLAVEHAGYGRLITMKLDHSMYS